MQLLNKLYLFFAKNPIKAGVFFIVFLIVVLSASILYIENYNSNTPSYKESVGSNLINYDPIRQKIGELVADKNNELNPTDRDRIIKRLSILEDKKMNSEDKYKAIQEIVLFLSSTYSDSNNSKYKKLALEIGEFVKVNFPNSYNKNSYSFACQDESCAEEPQPKEILDIVNDINNSDLPDYIKKSLAKDMLNTGYLPNDKRNEKAKFYFLDALDSLRYNDLSNSGAGEKIHDKLIAYLTKEYPKELEKLEKDLEEQAKQQHEVQKQ